MKLLGYLNLTGVITCETGLLIGGNDSFGIGGIDKSMIRQSFNGNRPYIPGSSLKGKMRHLLEQSLTKINGSEVHSCENQRCPICRIFGAGKTEHAQSMSRLVIRDAKLIVEKDDAPPQAKETLKDYFDHIAEYQRQHGSFVEIKTENYIDRKTGAAGAPRRFERVPSGMKFTLELVYRIFEDQDQERENTDLELFHNVPDALDLVRLEYLGTSGSRGYGRVHFSDIHLSFTETLSRREKWGVSIQTEDLRDWSPPDDLRSAVSALSSPSQIPSEARQNVVDPKPEQQRELSNED
jgi:CRISPR-associated protein Csm3